MFVYVCSPLKRLLKVWQFIYAVYCGKGEVMIDPFRSWNVYYFVTDSYSIKLCIALCGSNKINNMKILYLLCLIKDLISNNELFNKIVNYYREILTNFVSVTGQRNMSKLETLLEDGLRSELLLQQQLRALSEALRQQLQETERRQTEELERRIHQNALLSTGDRESGDKNELNNQIE